MTPGATCRRWSWCPRPDVPYTASTATRVGLRDTTCAGATAGRHGFSRAAALPAETGLGPRGFTRPRGPERSCTITTKGVGLAALPASPASLTPLVQESAPPGPGGARGLGVRASAARVRAALTSRSRLRTQVVQVYSRLDRASLVFTAPQSEHVLLEGKTVCPQPRRSHGAAALGALTGQDLHEQRVAVVGHGPPEPVALRPAGHPFHAQGLPPTQAGLSVRATARRCCQVARRAPTRPCRRRTRALAWRRLPALVRSRLRCTSARSLRPARRNIGAWMRRRASLTPGSGWPTVLRWRPIPASTPTEAAPGCIRALVGWVGRRAAPASAATPTSGRRGTST